MAETFRLEITMGNDAMIDRDDIARKLSGIRDAVRASDSGSIRDDNGNTVGRWEITTTEETNR